MKVVQSVFCTSLVFLISFFSLSAQYVSVSDDYYRYDKARRPVVEVTLEPEAKEVKEAFEDFMKDRYDVKLKGSGFLSNKDVLTAEAAEMPVLSTAPVNFYARIVPDGRQTKMQVFTALAKDVYLDPSLHAQQYAAMRDIVTDFVAFYVPAFYQESIDEAQKMVEDTRRDRQKLEEEIQENESDIAKMERKIQELQTENKQLERELDRTREALNTADRDLNDRRNKLQQVNRQLKNGK